MAKYYEFYQKYGVGPLIIVLLILLVWELIRIVIDEDKSAIWRARFYLVLYKLRHHRKDEKKYIANDIKGKINLARRKLHHGKAIIPQAVSIEWVEEEGPLTYEIKEGEFVVRLKEGEEQEKNIVDLSMIIVQKTTLLGIRHVMEQPLKVSVDFCLVQSILKTIGHKEALAWFFSNKFAPLMDQEPDIKEAYKKISNIDERGLFTRMLLMELEEFADKILGKEPRLYMVGEIEGLVDFIYRIVTKQFGQDVPLQYNRAYIRIGVVLVAKTSRILEKGIEPYVKAMSLNAQKGLNTIYVICYDKDVLSHVDPIAYESFQLILKDLDTELLKTTTISKEFSLQYTFVDQNGHIRKAICSRYIVKSTR